MKKLFTLSTLLLFALCVSAQEKKTWDFTQGLSYETIENLNADATNWAENGNDADGNVNNWKNNAKPDPNSPLMANGVVIPETAGLLFDIGNNKSNSIHLATTKLRLTRKGTTITFPQLVNGQKITIVGRSANSTAENRGIAPSYDYIKFVSGTQTNGACIFLGNQVDGSEGTYTFVWQVQTDSPDPVDVKFQLTPDAGIDFTLFMIDEGDAPDVEEAQPIGYLYSGSLDDDYAYAFLSGDSRFALTEINVDETEAKADSLWKFNGIVVSPTIGAESPYLSTIKNAIAYVPTLNFNPALYPALELGSAVATETNVLTVTDPENKAFEGLDVAEGIELFLEGAITGVNLGDYCANDQIVAKAGDVTAMHIHNAKRNAYMLLPIPLADMPNVNVDLVAQLIPQALQAVVETKQEVKSVAKPVISVTQENGYTTVALSANYSTKIFYTTDGSDPTTESTVYTEPFTLTQNATVKAMGIGDGYTPSDIASKDVVIMTQAAAPVFTVAREAGKSVVSISGASEGATVYYNFNNSNVITESKAYTEPVEITTPTTIYAFASGGDFLVSEIASKFVGVDGIDNSNIRWDVMAHFDANADDWKGKGQQTDDSGAIVNANYFFTWGKNAGQYYDYEKVKEVVKGSEGQDSTIYEVVAPEVYEANGWILKSRGQVLTWESLNLGYNIGDTSMRNPDTAADVIGVNDTLGITPNAITFGKQPSDGPFNASLETTAKYQAPFDVIVYAGNGNDGEYPKMQIEVSADGENWTKIGDVDYSLIKRNWKRTQLSYDGADEVFVRLLHTQGKSSGQIYDIYVMNNGEYSKQYSESALDGIVTVAPATVNLGETAILPVLLANSGEIDGMQFDFTLPAGVTVAADMVGGFVVTTTDRSNKLTATCAKIADNTYRVILLSINRAIVAAGNGAVLNIQLQCADDVTGGDYDIAFTNVSVSRVEGDKSVNVKVADFTAPLTVVEISKIPGDVDGNYTVDVTDVMIIVDYILNRPCNKFNFANADLDGDGIVNVTDAMNVVNIILHKSNIRVSSTAQKIDRELLRLGTSETGCQLHTAFDSPIITALQMEVTLPEGCRLNNVSLTGKAARSHMVKTNQLSDHTYNVVVFSIKGSALDTDVPFLQLDLEGNGGLVEIENILCTDTSHESLTSPNLSAEVTGITTVTADDSSDTPVYNLAGQRLEKPRKGINITNGKKVVVK